MTNNTCSPIQTSSFEFLFKWLHIVLPSLMSASPALMGRSGFGAVTGGVKAGRRGRRSPAPFTLCSHHSCPPVPHWWGAVRFRGSDRRGKGWRRRGRSPAPFPQGLADTTVRPSTWVCPGLEGTTGPAMSRGKARLQPAACCGWYSQLTGVLSWGRKARSTPTSTACRSCPPAPGVPWASRWESWSQEELGILGLYLQEEHCINHY